MTVGSHDHTAPRTAAREEEAKRSPGRPRSPLTDRAILDAARRVLERDGYAALSLEAVAAEAGVGRATIYRRYRDKRDLVAAALSGLIGALGPIPDTGSTVADLLALQQRLLSDPRAYVLTGTLLAEEPHNPRLLERFRERGLRPVRAGVRAALERGIARGEVRADLDLEAFIDLLGGAALQRHLAGHDARDGWSEAVVTILWAGIASARGAANEPDQHTAL